MMNLSINTSSSPKGWRYVLLHSPKNKLKPYNLPFLIVFFGVGFLIGSTLWSNQQHIKAPEALSLKTDTHRVGVGFLLGGTMWNNTISDQRHIKTNKDMTVSGSIREQQEDHHVTHVEKGRKGSLSLCWLMSFPVSIPVHIL